MKHRHAFDDFVKLKDRPFEEAIAQLAPDAPDAEDLFFAAHSALELGDEPMPDQRPAAATSRGRRSVAAAWP